MHPVHGCKLWGSLHLFTSRSEGAAIQCWIAASLRSSQ